MKLLIIIVGIAVLVVVGMLLVGSNSETARVDTTNTDKYTSLGISPEDAEEYARLGVSPEDIVEIQTALVENDKIRLSDPQFFVAVSRAMFEHDPIGINFETNADEYDAEAGTVIPRLDSCNSADDVATVLHEEFSKWFGEESAGGRDIYEDLAQDIWKLHVQRLAE